MKQRDLVAPLAAFAILLAAWEITVRYIALPPQVLPAPSLILQTLGTDAGLLLGSLLVTLRITFTALLLATVAGVLLAVLFAASRFAERALFPIAVIFQVTPVIAIAPLLLIYMEPAARCSPAPPWSPSFRFFRIPRSVLPPPTGSCAISLRFTGPAGSERSFTCACPQHFRTFSGDCA